MIYHIIQTVSGADLGYYEGQTPIEALNAMAREQSYKNYAHLLSVTGETWETHTLEVTAI